MATWVAEAAAVAAGVAVAEKTAAVAVAAVEKSKAGRAAVVVAALPVPMTVRGRTHVSMVPPGGKPVLVATWGETASRAIATH